MSIVSAVQTQFEMVYRVRFSSFIFLTYSPLIYCFKFDQSFKRGCKLRTRFLKKYHLNLDLSFSISSIIFTSKTFA